MRDKTRIIETLVGIAVISIFIICLVIIYRSANPRMDTSRNYYNLRAIFDHADGINLGSEVMISGVKVGSVSAMELDENNYTAIATLTLANKIKVPVDSSAEIVSFSLLGDKYINIVIGSEGEFLKRDEAFEFTQSAISIEQLLSKMLFGLDAGAGNKDEAKEDSTMVDELDVTINEGITGGKAGEETQNGENNNKAGHNEKNSLHYNKGGDNSTAPSAVESQSGRAESSGVGEDNNVTSGKSSGQTKGGALSSGEQKNSGSASVSSNKDKHKINNGAKASEGQQQTESTGMSDQGLLQDELNLT